MPPHPPDPEWIQPLPEDAAALARFEQEGPFLWLWEPAAVRAVLGRSTPLTDVYLDHCRAGGVPVHRRTGGGGAVVLSPGVLVITACYRRERWDPPNDWLRNIATAIAAALQDLGAAAATVRGHGDVCLGERKILGSSLYAKLGCVLYQGSLLVSSDLDLIDRYLPHPGREPDYRAGRPHRAFVTTLRSAGYRWPAAALSAALRRRLAPVTGGVPFPGGVPVTGGMPVTGGAPRHVPGGGRYTRGTRPPTRHNTS